MTHWVLTERVCPNCRYTIHPGWNHEVVPQRGNSHVVCKLIKVELFSKFGRCEVCGAWCSRTVMPGTDETVDEVHHGPYDGNHEARPGPAPLVEILDAYLTNKGVHPE